MLKDLLEGKDVRGVLLDEARPDVTSTIYHLLLDKGIDKNVADKYAEDISKDIDKFRGSILEAKIEARLYDIIHDDTVVNKLVRQIMDEI